MIRYVGVAVAALLCLMAVSCGNTGKNAETVTEPAAQKAVPAAGIAPQSAHNVNHDNETINDMQESASGIAPETGVTDNQPVRVKIYTTMGDIIVALYDDTPVHRDNFVKLVKSGYYNETLFHRVINDFMVQAGDPDSKNAPKGKMLGMGDPGYTLEAEIVYPRHFHKRGALAAARQGDQTNPERRSSGSQFYIVTGNTYNEGQLSQLENQLLRARQQEVFNRLATERRDTIMSLRRNRDQAGLQALNDELMSMMEAEIRSNPPRLSPEQRQAYTTIGGTPHLDGQYTVFGEVLQGMDVVDAIQKVATDRNDRPEEDVKILKMELL